MDTILVAGTLYYLPANIEDVKALITRARNENKKIRTRGSYHSVPSSITPDRQDDIFIMLSKMNKVSIDTTNSTVTVEAGCHLGYDKWDPTKISTHKNSLFEQLDKARFAVPDMGGITHQTVAGFLSTGASGSCMKQSFNDSLISITFVPADQNNPIPITVSRTSNPDLFYAAGVSMGLLGIIVSVTFAIIPRFDIDGFETITTLDDCAIDMYGQNTIPAKSLRRFLLDTDFKRILWYPQPAVQKVVVWEANKVIVNKTILNYRKPYIRTPYHSFPFKGLSLKVVQIAVFAIYYMIGKCPPWLARRSSFNKFFYRRILPGILNLFVPLNERLPNGKLKSQEFNDYWHSSLPMDNDISDTLLPVKFAELWIPFDDDSGNDNVEKVLQSLNLLFANMYRNGQGSIPGGAFSIELFPGKKSDFWMSPGYGADCLRVDVFWYGKNRGNPADYFQIFWDAFESFKFRCHWGKYLPDAAGRQGVTYLKARYPKWNDFMKFRARYDPSEVFVNDYWKRHLDIP